MKKTVIYGNEGRQKLLEGVKQISKAVKVTLGPSGKNVLIRNQGATEPFSTKDGVTVAAQIFSEDVVEQQAIEAMQSVANNADNKAGDGTTTATVLAEALFEKGCEEIDKYNVIEYKDGINWAVETVVDYLKGQAITIEDDYDILKKVALIASNNDKHISEVVVDAYKVAGKQGVVNIKRSHTRETYLSTVKGMNLDTGYRSAYYINDHKNQIVDFDKPFIYATNEKITSITDNLNTLLKHCSTEQIPLLIICKDMDESISENLIINKRDNTIKVCVCKAPGFGQEQIEELKDLGTVIGKEPFLEHELDFNTIPEDDILSYMPRVEQVIVTDNKLLVKGPLVDDKTYEKIEKDKEGRADKLRTELENQITSYEKARLQMRISRLSDGIAYIHIGAESEIEYNEKQHRIQDALYAVKSAAEEGIIPGGGYALNFFKGSVEGMLTGSNSKKAGARCLFDILSAPMEQILDNVGLKLDQKVKDDLKHNWDAGYDARTKLFTSKLIENGIIDPVKVTRVALENAASIVSMLLTTECIIVDDAVYTPQHQTQFM